MTRIKIDLNSLRGDGLTRARRKNADGELTQGMIVTAFEPDDRIAMPAYVERAEAGSPYVLLRVNRAAARDDLAPDLYVAVQAVLAGNAASSSSWFGEAIAAANNPASAWKTEDAVITNMPSRGQPQSA